MPHARGLRARPLGQVPGLDGRLRDDLSTRLLDGRVQRRGRFGATLLAREQRDGRIGRHRRERGRERLLDLGLLPALDALDQDHAAPHHQRHRRQRPRDALRAGRLALQRLHAVGPAIAFGQRAQARAALGDRAVIVAVNQIRGLELGH